MMKCPACQGEKFVGRLLLDNCPTCHANGYVKEDGSAYTWMEFGKLQREGLAPMEFPVVEKKSVLDEFFEKWETETLNWFIETQRIYINEYDRYKAEYQPKISKANQAIIRGSNKAMIAEIVKKDMAGKKETLLEKIGNKVGEITELDLHCGNDGTPNGKVKGTKGTVKISTIVAGGYIQCLHYRVLVK